MTKIAISIIEDHKVIRTNVSKFLGLQDDFELSYIATSVEDFFHQFAKKDTPPPQVLLLDIGLPGISGLDAIPKLLEVLPDLEIVMLTTYEEESKILKALCTGASAYLSKKSRLDEIANTIRIVNEGGSYMSPSIAREIVDHLLGGRKSKATMLTPRQKEIIELLANGKSYNEISRELNITFETVRTHVKKMYRALHVNNKASAIAMYLKGEIQ